MLKRKCLYIFSGFLAILLLLTGCLQKVERTPVNYYVLEYQQKNRNCAVLQIQEKIWKCWILF